MLEIGVGLGRATKEIHDLGVVVDTLDICNEALDRVVDFTRARYLHRDIENLSVDEYDLAVSLLVTQHMSDRDILWQFPRVFRSLNQKGRFVVQWAGSRIDGENDNHGTVLGEYGPVDGITPVGMISGRMVRSESHATSLIERSGGKVLEIRGRREFPEFKSCWFVTECRKVDG